MFVLMLSRRISTSIRPHLKCRLMKSTDSMSKGGELNNAEMPLPSHALTAKFGLRKPD